MKLKPAIRRIKSFSDRWILPPPGRIPEEIRLPEISGLPLLMISQVQRSGGTLLSQLLDGHSSLRVFPGELHIAKPKADWPRIRPSEPPTILFRRLVDHRCIEYAKNGYSKSLRGNEKSAFDYDVNLHHALFCHFLRAKRDRTARQVLDVFFETFFVSWRKANDVFDLSVGKAYYCGFAAGFSANPDAVDRYFSDYPDGYLVSIIRNPDNWLASALNKETSRREFIDRETALSTWQRAALALDRNVNAYGEKVIAIRFRDLVADTGRVMKSLSERLGIDYSPTLTVPSFDGMPIESNSSFTAVKGKIDAAVLERTVGEDRQLAEQMALYHRLSEICI